MDLENAIRAHAEWKLKFRSAIQKRESMDAPLIGADDCCPLGKWLHGEAHQKFQQFDSYSDCAAKHRDFHRQAGEVARTINAGKFDDAGAMIENGTPYAAASTAVGVALMRFRREAGL